jgi:hypothetical protein
MSTSRTEKYLTERHDYLSLPVWEDFYSEQLGWHIGHCLGIKEYLAYSPCGFSLMNLLRREPRRIFEAHVLEAKAIALLQRLNSSAYPIIHHRSSGDSPIPKVLDPGKQSVDLAQLGGSLHPPSSYL